MPVKVKNKKEGLVAISEVSIATVKATTTKPKNKAEALEASALKTLNPEILEKLETKVKKEIDIKNMKQSLSAKEEEVLKNKAKTLKTAPVPVIKIKRSSTTSVPSVTFGELAFTDIAGNSSLYVGNLSNNPVLVGSSNFLLNDTVDTTSVTGIITSAIRINVCTVSSQITRTLPLASTASGKRVTVSNSSASTATVTVAGAVFPVILNPSFSAVFESDGTNWQVISYPANDTVDTTSTTGIIDVVTALNVVTTSVPVTRTLPSASFSIGEKVTVVNSVSSTAIVTISGAALSISLNAGQSAIFESDGIDWQIISNYLGSTIGIVGSGTANQFTYFSSSSSLTSSNLLSQVSGQVVLGSGEGATPSAVTLRGALASGSNVAGANMFFQGSNSTGSAMGGDIVFQTAPSGAVLPTITTYTQSSASSTTFLPFNHTVLSGSNTMLVVQVVLSSINSSVSSITYNSVPLTRLSFTSSVDDRVETWYLVNPSVGTFGILINLVSGSGIAAGALNLINVNQTTPFGTPLTSNSGGASSVSLSPASSVGGIILDFIGSSASPTISGGQSAVLIGTISGGGSSYFKSSFEVSAAISTTVSYNLSGASYAMIAVMVNPVSVTPTVLNNMAEIARVTADGLFNISGILKLSSYRTVTVTGPITTQVTLVNATSNTTQTLPSANTKSNQLFIIKNLTTNTVTVASAGGTIESSTTVNLGTRAVGRYYSDGTKWWGL